MPWTTLAMVYVYLARERNECGKTADQIVHTLPAAAPLQARAGLLKSLLAKLSSSSSSSVPKIEKRGGNQ